MVSTYQLTLLAIGSILQKSVNNVTIYVYCVVGTGVEEIKFAGKY